MCQQVNVVVHQRDAEVFEIECVSEARARAVAHEEAQWESCSRVEIPALGIVIEGFFN